ncbi:sensor histidine kinase [Microbacterium sp. B2969]|uniref:histidine kinase n=1 Tax=Microbacterium alkaliflavum TaxID=3248839 RepID=A0ABW7QCD1_9MICO
MTGTAPPAAPRGVPPWVWDAVGALCVVLGAFVRFPELSGVYTVIGAVAVLLPAVFVFFRRRIPWVALPVTVVCYAVALFTWPTTPLSALAMAIAMYTVAVMSTRRVSIITALVIIIVTVAVTAIVTGGVIHAWTFQIIVTFGFATALGDAVRTRRAYIAEIMQRAVRAEQTREAEASRRVAEDRLRIARDLHDAVAHQISVISLNAGVASSALDADPEAARRALATIRSASRDVLGEIGNLLATLRLPEEQTAPRALTSLTQLDTLLNEFEASGLHTTIRRDGDMEHLPTAVDVVCYRIIQEGLTNALKHGSAGRAHVWVAVRSSSVDIVIANPAAVGASSSTSGGHGLLGVRERAESVNGTVVSSTDATGFRLEVHIPLTSGAVARAHA